MTALLKAEMRKLLTVRSTYVIAALALILDMFFAGFIKGYKLELVQRVNPLTLQDAMTTAVMVTVVFGALVGILLMTHEYRYNTILYSLTSTKSRSAFLASKVITVSIFSLVLTALIAAAAPLFTLIGVHLADNTLAPQSIAYADVIWRVLFYGWGYYIVALLIAVLIRSQIGAIMTFFIVPGTLEGILSTLLKDNTSYLPFSALGSVIEKSNVLSYGQAAGVFLLYLVVGWAVAWALFLRRDAN